MTDDCKTFTDYQRLALRTSRGPDGIFPPLWYLALGMAGEAGEVANLVKKFERHGKPFDPDAVVDELGDVLWYVTVAAVRCGVDLAEVAERNVAKLRRRYPDGFEARGGGADADRAAIQRLVSTFDATPNEAMDHFAGADKMVAPISAEMAASLAAGDADALAGRIVEADWAKFADAGEMVDHPGDATDMTACMDGEHPAPPAERTQRGVNPPVEVKP